MKVDVYMHEGCPACEIQQQELEEADVEVNTHWLKEDKSEFRQQKIGATPTTDTTCDGVIEYRHEGVLRADELEEYC